jgi:hypothetical protein
MSKRLDALRKNSQDKFEKLMHQLEDFGNSGKDKGKSFVDSRFWKLDPDKAGNGRALIRFLPAIEGEELPLVQLFSHNFQGPSGQWLIENCPTTLGRKCPICQHNSILWKSGTKENKDTVSMQKRKLNYISNILVLEDEKHPENEGKVFLFKFGAKIYAKIDALCFPQFKNEKKQNPFDFWAGSNFKLIVSKVAGYFNYDQSVFMSPSVISDDDNEIDRIWDSEYALQPFVLDSEFKSYEELENKLDSVLNDSPKTAQVTSKLNTGSDEDLDELEDEQPRKKKVVAAPKKKKPEPVSFEDDDLPSFGELEDDDAIQKQLDALLSVDDE